MKTNLVHQKLIKQTQESTNSLRKDKTIQFKYNNDNKWNTVTLVKRGGKRTGIYPNEWNVKFKMIPLNQ